MRLARQSSVQIIFASDIAAGKTTQAIKGSYTPQQALSQLLDHSGLQSQVRDEHTFIIAAGADPGTCGRQTCRGRIHRADGDQVAMCSAARPTRKSSPTPAAVRW